MAGGAVKRRCVLVVVDRRLRTADWKALAARIGDGARLCVLPLMPGAETPAVASLDAHAVPGLEWLRVDELLDRDRFHEAVLAFLNGWAETRLGDGRTVDEAFRLTTGDSVWWTGPAAARHPIAGPVVPFLRAVWLVREAWQRVQPDLILCGLGDARMATIIASLGESVGCPVEWLPGSARPVRQGRVGLLVWFVGATLALIVLPGWILVRSLFARLMTGNVFRHPVFSKHRVSSGPAFVLSGWYPNHVREEQGEVRVWYWEELAAFIRGRLRAVSVRYLLHTTTFRMAGWKRWLRPFRTGWGRLRRLPEVLPISQCHPCLGSYVAAVPQQLRLMALWWRCERSERETDFQSVGAAENRVTTRTDWESVLRSFRFAGADVSCLFVPLWRRAVGGVAKWARNVEAVAASFREAGDVRAVLVHEEFYPKGMLTIAAARSLGIPTIGVQHGTIGPEHAVYMVPAGQISGAPMLDLFAAYGAFAEEILCGDRKRGQTPYTSNASEDRRGRKGSDPFSGGQFPRERVRIVGAPRLDALVERPLGRDDARRRLGWPVDQVVVLLTSEGFRLSEPVVRSLLTIAAEQPEWRIVLKAHPHDRSPDAYQHLVDTTGVAKVDVFHDRFGELLAGCDVLISGGSTTVLEALLAGKPVVCANFTSDTERYPYVEAGVALAAHSTDELRSVLPRALREGVDESVRRSFLRHHLGPTVDGGAREAFVELLRKEFLGDSADRRCA